MDTAGDVDKQACGLTLFHLGVKLVGPTPHGVQRLGVGGFIGIEYFIWRTDGAGMARQAYTRPRWARIIRA